MSRSCPSAVEEESLVAYWLSEIDPTRADAVEEHLFACTSCTDRLHGIARLVEALGDLSLAPPPIMSRSMLDAVMSQGVRVQLAELTPYGEGWHRIRDDVDLCVLRIPLDLEGVERLELEYCKPDGSPFVTLTGVAFYREADEVLLACERHVAAGHAAIRFRLTGISGGLRRRLVDCLCVNADPPGA